MNTFPILREERISTCMHGAPVQCPDRSSSCSSTWLSSLPSHREALELAACGGRTACRRGRPGPGEELVETKAARPATAPAHVRRLYGPHLRLEHPPAAVARLAVALAFSIPHTTTSVALHWPMISLSHLNHFCKLAATNLPVPVVRGVLGCCVEAAAASNGESPWKVGSGTCSSGPPRLRVPAAGSSSQVLTTFVPAA